MPPSSAALLLAAAAAVAAPPTSSQSHSLTRALNTASNRAVRRILLSRSWPSAEALNLSLRAVLMRQREREEAAADAGTLARKGGGEEEEEEDGMKCPVPRPILNILMNRRGEPGTSDPAEPAAQTLLITSSEERERQWVATQISVFRDSYGNVPGYDLAEAYRRACCLSPRVAERASACPRY